MSVQKYRNFDGVFFVQGSIATKGLSSKRVYGEKIISGYRQWDKTRSKLAAYLTKGGKYLPIKEGSTVLYLGAGSGTTPSHVSDLVGESGIVFCVEFAKRSMQDLIHVCEDRKNMVPLLADANQPSQYKEIVEKVDVIYQDVAQPNQVEIFLKNAREFLEDNGYGILMLKSRSVDVTLEPEQIYAQAQSDLEKEFEVLEVRKLDPEQTDHAAFILKKKSEGLNKKPK